MDFPTPTKQQELVSCFLEIAAGQSAETAVRFLQATSWKLEEAIQLFYVNYEGNGGVASSAISPPVDKSPSVRGDPIPNGNMEDISGDDEVRAPLPVKRETLYGDASLVRLQPSSVIAFRNFEEESKQPAVWDSDQGAASTTTGSRDNLASLYRPPFALMYQGTFDKAKVEASLVGKWLLLNLQCTDEFSSHMLNRDTWANEIVAQAIRTNFIFWQVYNDSVEGKKVCTYYNLVSVPAILVVDPVTGQKMRAWSGMVQPDRLLEDLLPYMERVPEEHHVARPLKRCREVSQDSAPQSPDKITEEEVLLAVAASMESKKGPKGSPARNKKPKTEPHAETSLNEKPSYPALPEEPKGSRELVCRVGVRLPDGKRVQRIFLRSDPVKLLWTFCCSLLEEGETRAFHFTQAIPGASKTFNYDCQQTFEEVGLSNSMVSLVWDD